MVSLGVVLGLLSMLAMLQGMAAAAVGEPAQPAEARPAAPESSAVRSAASAPLLARLGSTARFRARNPDPQVQTEGGDYGRDISKCNPGCDYTTGYRCCGDKCQDIELSCDA